MSATPTPIIGVAGVPAVAAALREIGFEVVTGVTFRDAAIAIASQLKSAPIHVVVESMHEPGFTPWVKSVHGKSLGVLLLPTDASVDLGGPIADVPQLPLPATVNDLLVRLGETPAMASAGHTLIGSPDAPAAPSSAPVPATADPFDLVPAAPAVAPAAPAGAQAPADSFLETVAAVPAPAVTDPFAGVTPTEPFVEAAQVADSFTEAAQVADPFAPVAAPEAPVTVSDPFGSAPAVVGLDSFEAMIASAGTGVDAFSTPAPVAEPVPQQSLPNPVAEHIGPAAPFDPFSADNATGATDEFLDTVGQVSVPLGEALPAPAVETPAPVADRNYADFLDAVDQVTPRGFESLPAPVAAPVNPPVPVELAPADLARLVPAAPLQAFPPAPEQQSPRPDPALYGQSVPAQFVPQPATGIVPQPQPQPQPQPPVAPVPAPEPWAHPVAPESFPAAVDGRTTSVSPVPVLVPTVLPPQGWQQVQPVAPAHSVDFFAEGISAGGCQVVFSVAGKGGAGKTTQTLMYGQTAGAAGLRVLVIDANRDQGDIGSSLRIEKAGFPTVLQSINGSPADAVVTKAQINAARPSASQDIEFDVVLAPPREFAGPQYASAAVYSRLLAWAKQKYQLVVIDTQIVEAQKSDLHLGFVIPELRSGAWSAGVALYDYSAIRNAFAVFDELAALGVTPQRTLVVATRWPAKESDADRFVSQFGHFGTFVGFVADDPNVNAQKSVGNLLVGSPAVAPVVHALLYRVTGNQAFAPAAPAKKRRTLFGGRR